MTDLIRILGDTVVERKNFLLEKSALHIFPLKATALYAHRTIAMKILWKEAYQSTFVKENLDSVGTVGSALFLTSPFLFPQQLEGLRAVKMYSASDQIPPKGHS